MDGDEAAGRSLSLPVLVRSPIGLAFTLLVVAVASARIERDLSLPYHFGFDGRLYVDAARVWLAGGDPWARPYEMGIWFGAPPPCLLLAAPFTVLPPEVATVVLVALLAGAAIAAIRSLKMSMIWLFFPPVLDGILVGSLDVAALALLVLAGRRVSWLAPFAKVYALVPMFAERRWRHLGITAALLIGTSALLPWGMFVRDSSLVEAAFARQAHNSFLDVPVVGILGALALGSLGFRRAGWLGVPALWPATQWHYAAISLPALTPLIGLFWIFPNRQILLLGLVLATLHEHRTRIVERVWAGRRLTGVRDWCVTTWQPMARLVPVRLGRARRHDCPPYDQAHASVQERTRF